jgi:hypothetical protein
VDVRFSFGQQTGLYLGLPWGWDNGRALVQGLGSVLQKIPLLHVQPGQDVPAWPDLINIQTDSAAVVCSPY